MNLYLVVLIQLLVLHAISCFKFNSSGPYKFDYLLGETSNFTTVAEVVFVDYEVEPKVIRNLKEAGKTVICYVSVGSFEEYRPDAGSFPSSVIGNEYEGWEGEYWVDIRQIDVLLPIMKLRFDQALNKGCEGIDPDNMEVYPQDSGFQITYEEQIAYNTAILNAIRSLGMMSGLKNSGSQVKDLSSIVDFVVVEECVQYKECDDYNIFITQGKPIFVVEYSAHWTKEKFLSDVCPLVGQTGMSYILKRLNLLNNFLVSCL